MKPLYLVFLLRRAALPVGAMVVEGQKSEIMMEQM
jgi:hypothetical protein